MSAVGEALQRLAQALAAREHPLADLSLRAPALPTEQIGDTTIEFLGRSVPSDVEALWEWSRGHFGYDPTTNTHRLFGGADVLPGFIQLHTIEQTAQFTEMYRQVGLVSEALGSAEWLIVMSNQDSRRNYWFELCSDQQESVPVRVVYQTDLPTGPDYKYRFETTAEFISAIAAFLEDGHWSIDRDGYWNYTEPDRPWFREAPWIA